MNSLVIGLILLIATGWLSLSGSRPEQYFQLHSAYIVGLGTLTVLFLTTPLSSVIELFKSMFSLYRIEKTLANFEDEIKRLHANRANAATSSHPLIAYGQQLWEQGVSQDLFVVLLSERRSELEARDIDVIHALKNLAKYPPALGMLGTVMGMIELFSSLDQNQDKIGSALSVAMTATFLGLIISNLVISPIADRLHVRHLKEQRVSTGLYELMLLINSNQPSTLINEEIKGRAA
jgi:chemotaxis protein MotA